jgi:predicted dehydrogenase
MTHETDTASTRRDFIKHSSTAAVGATLASSLAFPQVVAAAAPGDKLRIGFIGCGGRGTGAVVQAATADSDSVIHALADIFPDRLDSCFKNVTDHFAGSPARVDVPPERRFTGVDAHEKLLASGVEVVCLCAYPHFRPAHLEAAIKAGVHVFCEKPMAVDAPGLRRVRDAAAAAKAKNLSLVCGFCWRYNDTMVPFWDEVKMGAIGDVLSVHTTYHTSTLTRRPRKPEWSDMEFQLRNWWHFTWLSGDHIVEQACHSIDRMSWAMGDTDPAKCVALGGRAAREGPEHGNVYDHFSAIYEYPDGRRASHTTRQIDNCPGENIDYLVGSKGRGLCDGFSSRYELTDHMGASVFKGKNDPEAAGRMYQNEHDALFKSIRANAGRNDGEWMCRSTMLALMARMAAYTGQTISWQQAWESKEDLSPPSYAFKDLPMPPVAVPGKTKFT